MQSIKSVDKQDIYDILFSMCAKRVSDTGFSTRYNVESAKRLYIYWNIQIGQKYEHTVDIAKYLQCNRYLRICHIQQVLRN